MENWTKCEDLLPLVGDDILVLLDGEAILRGRRMHNGWSAFFADGDRSTGTRHVSHWMPLPALPGAEQKQQPKMSREQIAVQIDVSDINGHSVDFIKKLVGRDIPITHIENFMFWAEAEAKLRVIKADALLAELSKTQP